MAVAPNETLIAVGSEGEPAAVYLLDAAGGVHPNLNPNPNPNPNP